MADPFEKEFPRIEGPRPLDKEFRVRLEKSLIETKQAAGPKIERSSLWAIDGPRAMPPAMTQRLEKAFAWPGPWAPSLATRIGAAALAMSLVAGLLVVASAGRELPRPGELIGVDELGPSHREPAPGSLATFSSSEEFLEYVQGEALKLTGPYGIRRVSIYGGLGGGLGGFSGSGAMFSTAADSADEARPPPAPIQSSTAAGSGFSSTNVQEEGVDEPDLVKTDGSRLAILSNSRVWLLDVTGGGALIRSSLEVEGGIGIFLTDDRLIHFTAQFDQVSGLAQRGPFSPGMASTKVTVIDVADIGRPEIVSSMRVEGSYVGARLAGGVVRLVVQSSALGPMPAPISDGSPQSLAAAVSANRRAVTGSSVGDWLPHYVLERPESEAESGPIHDWDAVSRPPDRAGISMLSVMTIDPADPRPDNAVSVIGAGETIYSSLENLYVTSSRLDDLLQIEQGRLPDKPITRIHKFDITDPARARYLASGEVPGYLLNQFSLSEHDGFLRVAATLGVPSLGLEGSSESFVSVLGEQGGALATIGSVGNLGKGERIYSVRFIGSMGYVVTFRKTDPLYVIDLRDPSQPQLKGELKVPGFSFYLHPLEPTTLLGVGNYVDESSSLRGGLQFSLFDVSDPANPRRTHDRIVGERAFSEVEQDHHSFLYWEPTGLLAVPAQIYDHYPGSESSFVGVIALTATEQTGFGEPIRLTHKGRPGVRSDYATIRRSLVIGDAIFTVSNAGVLVSDSSTFADRVWVPFPS